MADRIKVREERNAYQREWRSKNKERVSASNRKYRETHREAIREQQKRYWIKRAERRAKENADIEAEEREDNEK